MHGAGRDTEEGMGERNVRQMRGGRRPSHGRDNLAAEHSVLVGQNRVSGTFTSGMDMDAHETGSGSVGRFEKGSVERCVPIYALRRLHIAHRYTGGSATTSPSGAWPCLLDVQRGAVCCLPPWFSPQSPWPCTPSAPCSHHGLAHTGLCSVMYGMSQMEKERLFQ
jgi:hypothetical protein